MKFLAEEEEDVMQSDWWPPTATSLLALALASCGGTTPEPVASPSGTPPAAPSAPAAQAPPAGEQDPALTAQPVAASEPAASTPEESTSADEPIDPALVNKEPAKMPERSPSEVLTGPDVAFMFDYNTSEVKQAAASKCSAKSEDDPQAMAKCLQDERTKFRADVLKFKKDRTGKVRLIVYQREGSKLTEIHDGLVKLADETGSSITVKPAGASKGVRPIFKGRGSFTVSVPNSYTVILEDPNWGRLSYEARVGLVGR